MKRLLRLSVLLVLLVPAKCDNVDLFEKSPKGKCKSTAAGQTVCK